MFQSSLEQCEQFLDAADDTGYATRPVQLFYALSQASRAIVAASPRVDNQAWKVSGHGLTAGTGAATAADVTVRATRTGLFPAVASAIGAEVLVPDEPAALREVWPLLPEIAGSRSLPTPCSLHCSSPKMGGLRLVHSPARRFTGFPARCTTFTGRTERGSDDRCTRAGQSKSEGRDQAGRSFAPVLPHHLRDPPSLRA
jgi:hypothetical protein